MIPKIIHQIWIGPKKMPAKVMKTWQNKNQNFKYILWNEKTLKNFRLKNKKTYEKFLKTKTYCGAVDIARVEIIEKFGGVYIDCDSECLETIEGAPFMKKDFFAVYDHKVLGHPGRINNGVIGSIPNHPILKNYVKGIKVAKKIYPPWKTIGGKLLTKCVEKYKNKEKIKILPAYTFWPKNHDGKAVPIKGKVYSRHFWGTTLGVYKK